MEAPRSRRWPASAALREDKSHPVAPSGSERPAAQRQRSKVRRDDVLLLADPAVHPPHNEQVVQEEREAEDDHDTPQHGTSEPSEVDPSQARHGDPKKNAAHHNTHN